MPLPSLHPWPALAPTMPCLVRLLMAGDRDLKSDMWRLATCVPIVKVFDFYDALHGYYTGERAARQAGGQTPTVMIHA